MLELARNPLHDPGTNAFPMIRSLLRRRGAPVGDRVRWISRVMQMLSNAPTRRTIQYRDPLVQARLTLASDPGRLRAIEENVSREIQEMVEAALAIEPTAEGNQP